MNSTLDPQPQSSKKLTFNKETVRRLQMFPANSPKEESVLHPMRSSQFVTRLLAWLVAVLTISSVLPARAQSPAQSTRQAPTPSTLYLPLVTSARATHPTPSGASDNPMADLLAQHAAHTPVTAAPAATAPPVVSASQPVEIGPGLYPLSGFDPNLPLDDLAPLQKIVGNADFVGLSEPFHTNGGAYQMKHRVFRYLVEERGFRVLGFESPFRHGSELVSRNFTKRTTARRRPTTIYLSATVGRPSSASVKQDDYDFEPCRNLHDLCGSTGSQGLDNVGAVCNRAISFQPRVCGCKPHLQIRVNPLNSR